MKRRKSDKARIPPLDDMTVPPTRERAAHAEAAGGHIEIAEPERTARGGGKAYTDSDGRPSRPWRVIDTLQALERLGTITAEQRAAGERFRTLYEISGRAGAPAAPLEPRASGGTPLRAIERRVEAGRHLAEAARILGAPGPLHAIVVEVVALGTSCAAWDRIHCVRKGRAAAMLAQALGILAEEWR